MSTIKVNRIENTSTTDGGVSIDTDGHVTIDGQQMPTAGPLSNRNLIINGAMQVAQRGATFSMSTTGGFCTDRFKAVQGSSFDWQSTLTQESDGPDGFSKSLKVNVDTASTPTGSQNAVLYYRLEGQDCQQLGYGSNNAKTTTLSFWVKSNKTGTYSVQLANNNPSKYLLVEYSINSADTWEYKTMSFVGDTASTVDNDNEEGLDVRWNLAAGPTDLAAPSNTWVSTAGIRASNDQVNLMDAVDNYWQITGVQLEVGSKATTFEHRSYGDELHRCSRYYEKVRIRGTLLNTNSSSGSSCPLIVQCSPKRGTPSITDLTSLTLLKYPGDDAVSMNITSVTYTTDGHGLTVNMTRRSASASQDLWFVTTSSMEFNAEL